MRLSRIKRNNIPPRKPTVAGSHATFPCSVAMSIEGIKSDHTDAAIITPDANPSNTFSTRLSIPFFIKNTIAEPRVVPSNGINSPTVRYIFFTFL